MTKPAVTNADKDRPLVVDAHRNETEAQTMARVLVSPFLRHGIVANGIADKGMGKVPGEPRYDDYGRELKSRAAKVALGDLCLASELLTAQALSLDSIFAEMARRSVMNMGDYFDASERYMRLALKAQANSRATIETLARLHQPREQTVKHVHVNEGGQAVVAEQFHHHAGGSENAETVKQSHAAGAAGTSPALSGQDARGNGVPIPGGAGQAKVPNARRNKSGSA